jgi:hypothetical protein
MNEGMGTKETFGLGATKGSDPQTLSITGQASVELYEGEALFSADNGKTFSYSELLRMPKDAILDLFRKVGQGMKFRAENVEQWFVQVNHVWCRPANMIDFRGQPNLVTEVGGDTVGEQMTTTPTEEDGTRKMTGIKLGLGANPGAATAANVADKDVQKIAGNTNPYKIFSPIPSRGTGTSSNVITFVTTFATTDVESQALEEAVMTSATDAATDGTGTDACSRIVFSTINKGTNDTLTVQFDWQFGATQS